MTARRRRPLAPGVAYSVLATAVLIALGAVALTVAQPPPPTIAEFAPQAVDRIPDAPDEQAATSGGRAAEVVEALTPVPTPAPDGKLPPIEAPRVRRCVGDPPRQTEDPQSPPCVPYWDSSADNGGATTKGVTRTEIRVAWPQTIERPDDMSRLAAHFNSRYELYGRRMVIMLMGVRGGVFGRVDPAAMQADADTAADEKDAFASLAYVPRDGAEHYYYDRLASKKVLSVDSHATLRTEADLAAHQPYQWSVLPTYDRAVRQYAEWLCNAMVGRRARHADPALASRTPERRFGLLNARTVDGTVSDVTVLRDAMTRCGAEPVVSRTLTGKTLQEGQNAIVDLQLNDVTSVVCLCNASHLGDQLMPAATSQGYGPEWLVQTFQYQDYDSAGQSWPPGQAGRAFGVTFRNKWLPMHDMPWFWAVKESDPSWSVPPGEQGWYTALYERYVELLVLASGIQLAGPNLTPQTFQQGLFEARFPNPGAGGPPYFQSRVSFGPARSFFDDGTMIWWNPSERGHAANLERGTFCYVRSGQRYGLGSWPSEDPPYFQGACR